MSPTAKQTDEGISASSAASRATSAKRSWATNALASESLQDVRDLGPDQMVVDGDQVPAGLEAARYSSNISTPLGRRVADHVARLAGRGSAGRARPGWPGRAAPRRCTRSRPAPPAPGGPDPRAPVPRIQDRPSGPIPRARRRAGTGRRPPVHRRCPTPGRGGSEGRGAGGADPVGDARTGSRRRSTDRCAAGRGPGRGRPSIAVQPRD